MTAQTSLARDTILRPQMPELDTIRGIAVLGVFLYHGLYCQPDLAQWPQPARLLLTATWPGRFGVNLFFVLSGFLITGILVDSRSRPEYYARFYKRRALRILPAYLAMIIVLAVTGFASRSFLLLSLAFLANFAPLLRIEGAYRVFWSLAVEEHFYLLWPMACRKSAAKKLMMVCAGIVMLSPIFRYVSFLLTLRRGREFLSIEYTWNSMDGLACGALLALCLRGAWFTRSEFAKWCSTTVLFSLLAWCCAIPLGILSTHSPVGVAFQTTFLNFAFAGLLGLFLVAGSGKYAKLVQIKPLRFLGYISYGLYLVHTLLLRLFESAMARWWNNVPAAGRLGPLLVKVALVGILSVAVAYLSRKYFEERFLQLKGG